MTNKRVGSPLDFSNAINPDGTVNPTTFRQFLEFLGRDNGDANNGTGARVISRGTSAGALSSGGAGGGTNTTPPSGTDTALYNQFMVINVPTGNLTVYPGQFVSYTSTTGDAVMRLADNRYQDTPATHYVAAINGGVATLSSIWGSAQVRFADGKNTLDTPILYLYRDGAVTDDRSDIVDSRSRPQPGVVWDQVLGYRIGRKGNTTCLCSVSVVPARGPLG